MTDKLLIDRELLERVAGMTDRSCIRAMDELRATLAAPRQPEGLEVVGTLRYFMDYPDSPNNAPGYITHQFNPASWDHAGEAVGEHPLCRLSDAQRAIAELREECDTLRQQLAEVSK